jgi:hypothetical protein
VEYLSIVSRLQDVEHCPSPFMESDTGYIPLMVGSMRLNLTLRGMVVLFLIFMQRRGDLRWRVWVGRVCSRRALCWVDLIMLLKPRWRTPLAVSVAVGAAHVLTIFVTTIHYAGRKGRRPSLGWVRLLMNPRGGALPGIIRLMQCRIDERRVKAHGGASEDKGTLRCVQRAAAYF